MQAMILAAGLGTRLLPHTSIRPKPLFPVLNSPLLLLTISRLKNFGFDHIIVNCHHLREQIVDTLKSIKDVVIIEEEIILGTGGGLRGAVPHMRNEPILITNGDIYHTVNFSKIYGFHRERNNSITLGMHDYSRFNTVAMNGDTVDAFSKDTTLPKLAYTGLQVVEPDLLEDIEEGRYSCIIEHYRKLLTRGIQIDSYRVDNCYWTDMGTVGDYLALHEGLLAGSIPCWQEMGEISKPFCIAKEARLPVQIELEGWGCIGAAEIGNKAYLKRCVVWDDVFVQKGVTLSDSIVSSDQR
jgi:mannose-1-phosphate guanylyltransferase